MGGFAAIVAHDEGASSVSNDEIAALAEDYGALRGAEDIDLFAVGEWARVVAFHGSSPVGITRHGESWSVVVGDMNCAGASTPLRDLDGQFAAVRHNYGAASLEVITDPFGMQDVYVAKRGTRTYVSTSALVLARHLRAEPDPLGIKLFLRAGVQFGPVTHWNGIERVEPATALHFRVGSPMREEVYWSPSVDERVRAMSLAETVDHCIEVGTGLFERRLRDRGLVSADLTGGFDSRLVTALLDRAGVSFATMTVAEAPVDARLAAAVADAGDWPFAAQALPRDWTIDQATLHRAAAWGDARLEVLDLSEVLWRQKDRSAISRLVVTGGGGENFGPSPWMQELWRAGRSQVVNFDNLMNMRLFLPLDVSVLRVDPRADAEEYAREVLSHRAVPYSQELNTTQLDVIHAYREVGHFGAYRSAGEAEVTAQLPCYFRDFWTAAFSARHRWRNGHRLHRGIIERLHPKVAAVETERGGPAAPGRLGNAARFLPYYARLARTATRKLRGRATSDGGARALTPAPYVDAVRILARSGVLAPDKMLSGSLYDPVRLENMVRMGENGTLPGWTLLGRIATVELAMRSVAKADGNAHEVNAILQ
jgi:hypothetical protein